MMDRNLVNDPALAIMGGVLLILLWLSAWSWLRVAKYPEEPRDIATYVTAATLGYGGLVLAYLLIMHS